MDRIGKIKVSRIYEIDISIIACEHGKHNIMFDYKDNTILVDSI